MEALILAAVLAQAPKVEAKLAAPSVQKVAPVAAVPAPAVAQPKVGTKAVVRVRSFFSIRAGDGPVRRLVRALRVGCP